MKFQLQNLWINIIRNEHVNSVCFFYVNKLIFKRDTKSDIFFCINSKQINRQTELNNSIKNS